MKKYNRIPPYTPIVLILLCCSYAGNVAAQNNKTTDSPADFPKLQQVIDHVPSLIDATPTLLPPQSNQTTVPKVAETQDNSWTDKKQNNIHNWVDRTAFKIDSWFGTPDPNKPADASLRLIMDQSYDKHQQYEFKPRIKGKIKLPTLQQKVSVVFGDDSLDNELDSSVAIGNENQPNRDDKPFDGKRAREDNTSIALRWSALSKSLPFDLDADLGIRSTNDVYARLKAKKDWQLKNDFNIYAEQIYRYGLKSENYLRTNLELTHARPDQAFISNQLSLTYADKQDDDLTWDNRLFRQHQFFENNRFNYGVYSGGYYDQSDLRLNSWGPFVSWRQPLWREWFYIQGDLNYFNQHREQRSHYLSTVLRLEALF
ncbi:hypothetical protein EC844_101349 [Acinetobacter calcoaceticus]|uniref:Selenocysteine synthase n=1 Tax=Acinetobacter calcoaceticus TaxID=471 RepID=A0A4R1Y1Q8_ACICA|nr:hypothetical protein EC844_101349 [Acinetobacter calcoaceticus]